MEDQQIMDLFWSRSEMAIRELDKKYHKLCKSIAHNILRDEQDAEECLNDSYMAVWNTIPPKRPENLTSYLCRITRNISLKRYHYNTAAKRNHYYDEVLDEIEEYIVPRNVTEEEVLEKEIAVELGVSSNYVNVCLHRTKKQLKQYLEGEGLL